MKEKCGVAAVASRTKLGENLYVSLAALQHRGQEAAGIAFYDDESDEIKSFKGLGMVDEVFKKFDFSNVTGKRGIGHVYYSIAISVPENAQPALFHTGEGDIAVGHNGIITNAEELKKELMEKGHHFVQGSEEESFAYMIADYMKEHSFENAVKNAMKKMKGSYAFVLMHNNRVFGIRDPLGIRPLILGKINDGYVIASESVAIDALGGEIIRDVMPGEMIEITEDGYKEYRLINSKERAHCFFEYVYFARADSVIDGREVYSIRKRLGEILAEEHPVEADVVVPIPDSGRAHAYGFAKASGLPLEEGLMKNRYIARTFIMPKNVREKLIQLKVNPVKSAVEGKRVVIVDDSIVRGTTMRKIVNLLRKYGAKEVHVRIASPPIIAPCYFGIDMTTREQLIASNSSVEEIRKRINADSLGYISIEGMTKAIGIDENELCLGCVTGKYPIKVDGEDERFQEKIEKWK